MMEKRKLLIQNLVLTFKSQIKKTRSSIQHTLKQYIPLNEFYVLRILFDHNKMMTVSEIASDLQVSVSHITGVSDKLVEKELINRERSTKDRRIVYLSITNKGKKFAEEMGEIVYKSYKDKFEDFTDNEMESFIHLLEKIKTEET
jgi:DNA-binding MarR family transcriptional regulator